MKIRRPVANESCAELCYVIQSCQELRITEMSVRRDETPRLFTSNESTSSSRSSKFFILRKKMEADKLALEVKLAEQKFADEIECLRAEQQQRAKILELKKKAEELRLEYEFEDAIAQEEGMSNNNDVDKELNELPVDDMSDRVSRLDKNTVENDVVDEPPIEPTNFTKPELAKDELSEPR